MKSLKRVVALLLVLVMLSSVVSPALAAWLSKTSDEHLRVYSAIKGKPNLGMKVYNITVHGVPLKVIVVDEKSKISKYSELKVKSLIKKKFTKSELLKKISGIQ